MQSSLASSLWPRECREYEGEIERAVKKYWGSYQFPLAWAAQLWQESRCDPLAVSYVGAAGLAQFMPATWAEVAQRLNLPPGSTPHGRIAIDAGAFYQARQMAAWTARRGDYDRWQLGLASYNGGLGNMLKAQRLCGDARLWQDIEPCLPQVTGIHANETRTYVSRIKRWWRDFGGCEPFKGARELCLG